MQNLFHVNEIKFEGDSPWILQFNRCSDLWQQYTNGALSPEEREAAGQEYTRERIALEMGYYND